MERSKGGRIPFPEGRHLFLGLVQLAAGWLEFWAASLKQTRAAGLQAIDETIFCGTVGDPPRLSYNCATRRTSRKGKLIRRCSLRTYKLCHSSSHHSSCKHHSLESKNSLDSPNSMKNNIPSKHFRSFNLRKGCEAVLKQPGSHV